MASIGICGLLGGLSPLYLQPAPSPRFSAEVQIKVQPADEASLAAAAIAMKSKASLDNVARALDLSQASGFAPESPSFLDVFYDIVSGGGTTIAQAEDAARRRLADAITIEPLKGGVVRIAATTEQQDDAGKLVQRLNGMFVDTLTSQSGQSRPVLDGLRQAMERAEAGLAGFIKQTGEPRVAALRQFRSDGQALARQIQQTETDLAALKEKLALASTMTSADVLAKPLPDSLEFTGLDYQRQRHVQASLLVDQLSASLGPRHPRLLAAQAALEDIDRDLQKAIRQLSTSLQRQQADTAKQLADLKARRDKLAGDRNMEAASERLSGLETAANDARQNYLQGQENEPALAGKPDAHSVQIVKPLAVAPVAGQASIPWAWCAWGAGLGLLAPSLFVLYRRRPDELVDEDLQATELDPRLGWMEDVDLLAGTELEVESAEHEGEQEEAPDAEPPEHASIMAANDRSLVDQLNDVLMAHRRPAAEAELPPLVAAVARTNKVAVDVNPRRSSQLESHDDLAARDVAMLRREMARLREKVVIHAKRKQAGRS